MKNVILFTLLFVGIGGLVRSNDTSAPMTIVGRITWDGRYNYDTTLPSGHLYTGLTGAYDDLNFDYTGTQPTQIPLFTLSGSPLKTGNGTDIGQAAAWPGQDPGVKPNTFLPLGTGKITMSSYMIQGEVKYENCSPGSYLEMWNYFGPASYFSRTNEGAGPMKNLDGSSDWREFWLPFDATGAKQALSRIEVNLHLNGPGKVWLRNLTLSELPNPVWQTAFTSLKGDSVVVSELSPEHSNAALVPLSDRAGAWKVTDIGGSLWTLSDPAISATHFAVIGQICYDNVSNGYLELTTDFAPEEPGTHGPAFTLRASEDEGPLARLKGSSDWRTFWLPFDSSRQKSRLIGLVVNLKVADPGVGNIYVRNVKLLQYPNGLFPGSLARSGTIPVPQPVPGTVLPQIQTSQPLTLAETKDIAAIDWKSFCLGISATVFAIALIGTSSFFFRRLGKRRHEREMRRIASLDS